MPPPMDGKDISSVAEGGLWPAPSSGPYSALSALVLLLVATAVVLNTAFLALLLRRPALRNTSNRLLGNLCLCNLLGAALQGGAWSLATGTTSARWRHVLLLGARMAASVEASGTLLVSGDRCYAISRPLQYRPRTAPLLLAWLWGATTLAVDGLAYCSLSHSGSGATPQYMSEVAGLFMGLLYSASIVSLSALYAVIYCAAHSNSRRRRRVTRGVSSTRRTSGSKLRCSVERRGDHTLAPSVVGGGGSLRKTGSTKLRKWSSAAERALLFGPRRRRLWPSVYLAREEARTAWVSLAAVGMAVCCWSPHTAALLLRLYCHQTVLPQAVVVGGFITCLCYPVTAPLLYTMRSQAVRDGLLRMGRDFFSFTPYIKRLLWKALRHGK